MVVTNIRCGATQVETKTKINTKTKTKSPVCSRVCCWTWESCLNRRSQYEHLYGFSPVCTLPTIIEVKNKVIDKTLPPPLVGYFFYIQKTWCALFLYFFSKELICFIFILLKDLMCFIFIFSKTWCAGPAGDCLRTTSGTADTDAASPSFNSEIIKNFKNNFLNTTMSEFGNDHQWKISPLVVRQVLHHGQVA